MGSQNNVTDVLTDEEPLSGKAVNKVFIIIIIIKRGISDQKLKQVARQVDWKPSTDLERPMAIKPLKFFIDSLKVV